MKIKVVVKANAKEQRVKKVAENEYKVWLREPARENRANKAMLKVMSDVLGVQQNSIKIVSGLKSKSKLLEI